MEYCLFGCIDLKVSVFCFGIMIWGEQNSEQDVFVQIVRVKVVGINFMDIVEMYLVLFCVEIYVSIECIIGNWFCCSSDCVDWIFVSKIVGFGNGISYVCDGNFKFNCQYIVVVFDVSLECLQIDWLDFYQLYWLEWWINFFGQFGYQYQEESFILLEEILEVFDEQVCVGKICYIGLFNEMFWGIMIFFRFVEECGWLCVVLIQNFYNLFNCSFEVGLVEIVICEQCGLLVYLLMVFGMFFGKYVDGVCLVNVCISLYSCFICYINLQVEVVCVCYVVLVCEYGMELVQMVLVYVILWLFVISNIIGVILLEQLEINFGSIDLRLDEEVFVGIDVIYWE